MRQCGSTQLHWRCEVPESIPNSNDKDNDNDDNKNNNDDNDDDDDDNINSQYEPRVADDSRARTTVVPTATIFLDGSFQSASSRPASMGLREYFSVGSRYRGGSSQSWSSSLESTGVAKPRSANVLYPVCNVSSSKRSPEAWEAHTATQNKKKTKEKIKTHTHSCVPIYARTCQPLIPRRAHHHSQSHDVTERHRYVDESEKKKQTWRSRNACNSCSVK